MLIKDEENMSNNLHNVFRSRPSGFVNKIKPTEVQRNYLNECRVKVRRKIKQGLSSFISEYTDFLVSPKFRIQGSWAYGTCNQPAKPQQEMDIDYGVYLPASLFNNERSDALAKKYFAAVEVLLIDLAKEERWQIDSSKETCVRLKLQYQSHMDIPLYIVPDDMFNDLEEKNQMISEASLAADQKMSINSVYYCGLESFSYEDRLIKLDKITKIHMAIRSGGWKESDCEIIRKWYSDFLSKQEDKGRQLRYIARYLKAWRDYIFLEGGPSSILLMVIANRYYSYKENRDDIALLNVIEFLPQALKNAVIEPSIPEHENEDFNRIPLDKRAECAEKAQNLYNHLKTSISVSDPNNAISFLRFSFGNRIPTDISLITIDSGTDSYFSESPKRVDKPNILLPVTGG